MTSFFTRLHWLLAALMLCLLSRPIQAQVDRQPYMTNGQVNALVRSGNTLYLGGSFTYVGPSNPYGTVLSTATGAPDLRTARPNGAVLAAVPDGAGGWYIGGNFSQVGGQARTNLAQLDATGAVTAFNPSPNSTVFALALAGSTLYAGGQFDNIGGLTRGHLAALDASTGTALSGFANPSITGLVYTLAVSGSTLYVGGSLDNIGGQTRYNLAALDAGTGLLTAFNPSPNNAVNALVVSGSTLYVGGGFTTIGGQARQGLAALDAGTGTALSGFTPSSNSSVQALALSGSTLYAGGQFTSIGGQARNYLAALDAGTGTALSGFNPSPNTIPYGGVQALAVSGSTLYVGGTFSSISGQPRQGLVALNVVTGTPLPVELSAFTAVAAGPGAVRLAWATASEKNSAQFEVERSADGTTFVRVGTVAAAGSSSSSARTYGFEDATPPIHQSTIYYRLRLVDADGTATYSPVRPVALRGAGAGLALYPNPAPAGAATLAGAAPGAAVTVYNALGRPVATATADAAGTAALAGLPAGVYVVRTGAQAQRLVVE